jgi:hypothetical protein
MCSDQKYAFDTQFGEECEELIADFLQTKRTGIKDYDMIYKGLHLEIKSHRGISGARVYSTFPAEIYNRTNDLSHYIHSTQIGNIDVIINFNKYNNTMYLFRASQFVEYVLAHKYKAEWNQFNSAKCILINWEEKDAGFFKKVKINEKKLDFEE